MICADIVDLRLCLGFTAHLPSVPGRLPASLPARAGVLAARSPVGARACSAVCDAGRFVPAGQSGSGTRVQGTLPGIDGRSYLYPADAEVALCRGTEEGNRRAKPNEEGSL